MTALAWIGMFVKVGAVEKAEPVFVFGKVSGNPIEDDPNSRLMAFVDEIAKVIRAAEATGRCEQADGLVAPRAVEGKLADRQKLQMGKAHIGDVRHQIVRHLTIAQIAPTFFGFALP